MQTPTTDQAAEAGFRAAFSATHAELVRYARRRVPPAEADDVVAETYLAAWRRWDDRPDPERPLPWLYGIAANVVRNRLRGERRRTRLVDRLSRAGAPAVVPGPEPHDTVLAEAMAALSFDDQEVLRLTAWERLAHAEIAVVLGCSVNAVAIRSHRAKGRLAAELRRRGAGPEPRQDRPPPGHGVVDAPGEPRDGGTGHG